MRIRTLVIAAAAAAVLVPLGGVTVGGLTPAGAVPPTGPVRELRMTTTGVCPPGGVLLPRSLAVTEYRRAHRFGTRQHFTRAQHRRLVICAMGSAVASPPAPTPAPTSDAAAWQSDMLGRINALRSSVGAAPLALCAPITRAAQGYADAMAASRRFDHVGADGSQPWDRMRAEGYRWSRASENIAKGQPDVAAVMAAWIASPGHYRNLVDPAVRHVGLGLTLDGAGTHWWVQEFGAGGAC